VPVLTLSGRSFASRVCGSLVRSAGQPELVCQTPQEFVTRAIALARNPREVNAYKAQLKANRDTCTLFDMDRLTASLEDLYFGMCGEYQEGRLPQPDLFNLPAYFRAGIEHEHEIVEMQAVADYHGLYKEELARLHRAWPLPVDKRIWTQQDVARADGGSVASFGPSKRRKAAAR
jgi:hypothetical protein